MAKTIEEIVQSMVAHAKKHGEDYSAEEARSEAEKFAPLPEGYTRLTPQTIGNYELPITATAFPYSDGDVGVEAATTIGKDYTLKAANPLFAMLAGMDVEFIDDDGDNSGSGGFSLYGWAVKDEVAEKAGGANA